ncbi:hypothetical protein RI367_004594 [Sorochytrium milnesiophthora]
MELPPPHSFVTAVVAIVDRHIEQRASGVQASTDAPALTALTAWLQALFEQVNKNTKAVQALAHQLQLLEASASDATQSAVENASLLPLRPIRAPLERINEAAALSGNNNSSDAAARKQRVGSPEPGASPHHDLAAVRGQMERLAIQVKAANDRTVDHTETDKQLLAKIDWLEKVQANMDKELRKVHWELLQLSRPLVTYPSTLSISTARDAAPPRLEAPTASSRLAAKASPRRDRAPKKSSPTKQHQPRVASAILVSSAPPAAEVDLAPPAHDPGVVGPPVTSSPEKASSESPTVNLAQATFSKTIAPPGSTVLTLATGGVCRVVASE